VLAESFTPSQVEPFDRDGYLIVEEGLVSPGALELLRARYERLFDGEYGTGIKPDEVNWVPGRDPEDRTRQICNGWRADRVIAARVLSARTGRLGAQLGGYLFLDESFFPVLWDETGCRTPWLADLPNLD